jgi:hypothetical protein
MGVRKAGCTSGWWIGAHATTLVDGRDAMRLMKRSGERLEASLSTRPSSTGKVLLVKGVSGLGDRILCALTAALYARLSERTLVIDWSDDAYSSDGTNAFHNFFLSSACEPGSAIQDTDSVVPAIWRGRIHETAAALRDCHGALHDAQGWRTFSIDLGRLDYDEAVAVLWTYGAELTPLLPHLDQPEPPGPAGRAAILARMLADTLTLQPAIQARVDGFRRAHFAGRMVGVHVRYSDYRTALRRTLQQLEALLRRDPACTIFLSTDNIQVRRLFEDRYGRVISTPHWYAPIPGQALHFGAARPDPTARGVEALIDLYLLAACDDLIVDTSSSFACVATLLTHAPASRVFDVKRRDKLPPRFRHAINGFMRSLRALSWAPVMVGMTVPRSRRG